jgi:RimJ/RimL family protein N-acetyltransferase
MEQVRLRNVEHEDLPIFFEQQLDAEANRMAAFTAKNPHDRAAFDIHWRKILTDGTIRKQTILYGDEVAGHILQFQQFGKPEVSYWIGKVFWDKGIATQALQLLLQQISTRPLFARAAKDNTGSIRVLQKCGFEIVGEDKSFANGRGEETEEYILKKD